MLHINILLSEYFLVQGSRSCNTEQNGSSLPQNGGRNRPARALAPEVWAAREEVSKREPALPKALPAPQLTGLHTLGVSPETPGYAHRTLGSAHGTLGASAAGQALGSRLGGLLLGARSAQGRSCHRNFPATAGRGPKPHGALAQPSNNPALKVRAALRLHPTLSTARWGTSNASSSAPSN